MIKVVLVDDQALVQQGVATLLNMTGDVDVVETFSSGIKLCQWIKTYRGDLDLILLDFHMPDQDGLETLRFLKEESDTPVVFLSTFADSALSREARRGGARGWLAKSIEVDDLIAVLRTIVAGGSAFPALEMAKVDSNLTPREYEIARCLVTGMTNQQIADQCYLSLGTVKNYTSNLFSKLEVANRSQAMAVLRERGIG